MNLTPAATYIEFDYGTPIPPDQLVMLKQPSGGLIVKVASNQRRIEGGFTIRGLLIEVNTMETKQIKEMLAGQGLSKQEVEIILGAIKGVKIAPLAYSQINDMADEVLDLKEYKTKAQGAIAILGGGSPEPKKTRAPRSDKGVTKAPVVAEEEVETLAPVKAAAEKTDKPKGPKPRAMTVNGKGSNKKESEEEIKANLANLGDGPGDDTEDEIPL